MPISELVQQLGIALGLGLLVGLQRESVASRLAGLRTFPIVTVLGLICAVLATSFGGWVISAGLISLAALIFVGKLDEYRSGNADHGLTTELAMLLMFGVGAYLTVGQREIAIMIGGGTAVLLHFKGQLHGAVAKLNAGDLKAIMQFALISMVILPVLPNRTYGPYQVLNPRNIWLMVVLIVGINLSGYIIHKFKGEKIGMLAAGVLGGLISSTATTAGFSRRTAESPDSSKPATMIILIASGIVFVRVAIEIATVSPAFLPVAIWPILVIMLSIVVIVYLMYLSDRGEINNLQAQENPSELRSAIFFGVVYAVVLFAVAFASEKLGGRGLFVVAALSGLTDVDAITLSASQMVNLERIDVHSAWRMIVVAILSNLVFKTAVIAILGHRRLLVRTGICFGITILIGILVLLFWPSTI